MSKRVQFLIPENECAVLKRHAKSANMSIGAWVRTALRRISDTESGRPVEDKLQAIERGFRYREPVSSISEMKYPVAI